MKTKSTSRKLLFVALFLFAGLFLTSQVMAYEARAQVTAPAIVNTNSVRVYTSPDINATVVDILGLNQVVTMLGRNADASMVYVRTPNSVLGWMQPQALTYTINLFDLAVVGGGTPIPNATATATSTATPQPSQPVNISGVVNTGALNIRSGPGVQYPVIDAVYFGDTVILVGRNADSTWVNIQTADLVRGWVNARYITPSQPISILPVLNTGVSTPTPLPPGVATAVPLPTGIPAPTVIPNTAVINTGNLNVRSGPGVGYARVTSVSSGNYVSLLGRNLDSSWANIATSAGAQGWVNSRYLTTSTSVASLPVTSQTGTGHVATGNLNIRTTPGASSPVLTVASYGAALTLLGRTSDNTWLMVRPIDGKEGWANAAFITTAMNINQLPSLSGPVPGQPAQPPAQPPANPGSSTSLRSCPNLTCPVTGSVYSGLAVTATGRSADSTWIFVVLGNGQQGWIQSQYVALSVPVSSLPVMN